MRPDWWGWLFVAGGVGTLARFGGQQFVYSVLGWGVPWGTAVVNILGCFGFGLLAELLESRFGASPEIRAVILAGFFGAFTTFSTYLFEVQSMIRAGAWGMAFVGFAVQNMVGFTALLAGIALADVLLARGG